MRIDEITGGSPYGSFSIAGGKGERMPSDNEWSAARFQGQHIVRIALKFVK
jgi:NAD(P)H dehydrogenase (quinone)